MEYFWRILEVSATKAFSIITATVRKSSPLCLASLFHKQPPFKLTFKRQPHKMVKHTQTIRWLLPTNCLSVFDYFVELVLKG